MRVLVIGGGAAGLMAAIAATRLIWERKLVMPSVSVCPQMFLRRA